MVENKLNAACCTESLFDQTLSGIVPPAWGWGGSLHVAYTATLPW